MSNPHIWRAAQERLRGEMTRAQFDTWLRGTELRTGGDGVAELSVRTTFARELLESRFRARIEAAIAEVTGKCAALRIVVSPAVTDPPPDAPAGAPVGSPDAGAPAYATSASTHARTRQRALPPTEGYARPSLFGVPGASADAPAPSQADPEIDPEIGVPIGIRTDDQAEGMGDPAPPAPRAGGAGGARGGMGGYTERYGAARQVSEERAVDGAVASRQGTQGGARMDGRNGFSRPDEPDGPSGGISVPPPKLNARYTFSTFIVGSANQLAHAASLAVAEAPGQAYNPLFLYGGVGLGKTHLLHAIGHTAIEDGLTVLYVSSETFTNEIINAIRYRTTEGFRAKYRSADVLLVDDIQFIVGKESTEEEFFHTFNSLYESNKQIVICSDRPPKAIVSLEERLRSRFEWGLIADIQPPDLETRVAILRAKADMMRRQVPDDVLTYLAGQVQSNIRELEGSFNRLLAISQLQNMPLTIETAKAALSSLATDGRQRRVGVDEVLKTVCEYFHLSADDLRGKQRDKHIVVPRQIAMYLMRQETEASLFEIGQALGGRDHSTVLHGFDKIGREVNENSAVRKEVLAIRQQLLG